MAKEWAKVFYRSKEWKQCRQSYIQSVNGLCETCLEKGRVEPGKILHHTILLTPNNINDPMITLNWEHLKFECQDCHNAEPHHKKEKSVIREGLMFNIYGELVEVKSPSPPINKVYP